MTFMAYKMTDGRTLNMTAAERKERARKAAATRWANCTDVTERRKNGQRANAGLRAKVSDDYFVELAHKSAAARRKKAK